MADLLHKHWGISVPRLRGQSNSMRIKVEGKRIKGTWMEEHKPLCQAHLLEILVPPRLSDLPPTPNVSWIMRCAKLCGVYGRGWKHLIPTVWKPGALPSVPPSVTWGQCVHIKSPWEHKVWYMWKCPVQVLAWSRHSVNTTEGTAHQS